MSITLFHLAARHRAQTGLLALFVLATSTAQAWHNEGHEAITRQAVTLVARQLPDFFGQQQNAMVHCSLDPDAFMQRGLPAAREVEAPEHYLDLERLRGEALPRARSGFTTLCRSLQLEPAAVGTLPYATVEWTQKLSAAFAEWRKWPQDAAIPTKIAVYAGILAHYTGDLAQPLHTTVHHDGRVTNPGDKSPKTGIHQRVDALLGHVTLPPPAPLGNATRVTDAWETVLGALRESHSQVDRVFALADRIPAVGTAPTDPEILEFARDRAAAAVQLTARLWLYAWQSSEAILLPDYHVRSTGRTGVRNVIVMVPDGTGSSHLTMARWCKGAALTLDSMLAGAVRTFNSESLITDSAPAATAFACGVKTADKVIGFSPESVRLPAAVQAGALSLPAYVPAASILEAARLSGRATGLVATSNLQHATPAAFSSHWPDRNDYAIIAEQQVHQRLDVAFGGGRQYLLPRADGGARADGKNLIDLLRRAGCTVVRTAAEMQTLTATPAWGLFADDDMAYDWDRVTQAPEQPSLAAMTRKAIELLAANPNGFFLFVEGSKVDWASHANDATGVLSDILAFDAAVAVAQDYARADGHTLVLAFPDHGNGGLSLGNRTTDKSYSRLDPGLLTGPLTKARLTAFGLQKVLAASDSTPERVRQAVQQAWGIGDLTDTEAERIAAADPNKRIPELVAAFNRRCPLGWTTTGHTGEDVPLYAFGPGAPHGLLDNTELAVACARAMGIDLAAVNQRLFVEATDLFPNLTCQLDHSDPANPRLRVGSGARQVQFILNSNRVQHGGETATLEGLCVMAPPRYAEIRQDNRIYVLGSLPLTTAAQQSGWSFTGVDYAVTRIGSGPGGETVVFEADPRSPDLEQRLMESFGSPQPKATRARVFLPREAARYAPDARLRSTTAPAHPAAVAAPATATPAKAP